MTTQTSNLLLTLLSKEQDRLHQKIKTVNVNDDIGIKRLKSNLVIVSNAIKELWGE